MDIQKALNENSLILAEAAVIETLRRSETVDLHPHLEHALLIYDSNGRKMLSKLYNGFIGIAQNANLPILLCTPTWRANQERISAEQIHNDTNGDAVRFLKHLRNRWESWRDNIAIGGLIGCKNDCYKPVQGLSKEEAEDFHTWQVNQLTNAKVDFLLAATLPAMPEALGIALALEKTRTPYIISFVINREGRILDGTRLAQAFAEIDAVGNRPPLGYMINCAYPSFLNAARQPKAVMSRLIGFQANASSLDHSELDGADTLLTEELSDWGNHMVALNRAHGIKILGGCCGTGREHLQYIVSHIRVQQA